MARPIFIEEWGGIGKREPLVARGWKETALAHLWGGNTLGLFRAAWCVS